MTLGWRRAGGRLATVLAVAGGLAFAVPAQAQFSPGYKFLEAVKKKDGQEVTDMLSAPGSTIVNTKDVTTGDSAMHLVVARRDLTWIQFLASKGANVNARNAKGQSPLQLASSLGFTEGVELLLKLGAKVDDANSTGETPLIAAVHNRDSDMVRVLLRAGADPRRNDNSGRSALDYASLDGHANPTLDVLEASLKDAAAKPKAQLYGPKL